MEENQNPGYEALETMNTEQKRIPNEVVPVLISELTRHKQAGKAFRHNPQLVACIKQYVLGDAYQVHFLELKQQVNGLVELPITRDWIHERTLSLSHATHIHNARNATNLSLDAFAQLWKAKHGDDAVVFIDGVVQRVVCYQEFE